MADLCFWVGVLQAGGGADEMAERFSDVDGKNRYALVALDPENPDEIVGVVRYAREAGTVVRDGATPRVIAENLSSCAKTPIERACC
jgi:uncharacterized alpha-E superfamily protein